MRSLSFYVLECATRSHALSFWRALPLLFVLLALNHPGWAQKTEAHKAVLDPNNLVIAVADFSGKDRELGRFLADTLLTDLAQSPILHLVERDEINRVLAELKLQATGLTEPQVQKVGRLVGANHLIVGSYFQNGQELLINVRLLNVDTGRVSPGGAANMHGSAGDMLGLIHKLARLLHQRLTGQDLPLDKSQEEQELKLRTVADTPSPLPFASPAPPALSTAHPAEDWVVTEGAFAQYLHRFGNPLFTVSHPNGAVTRVRALVALVRALVPPDQISAMGRELDELPDGRAIPYWARPYVDSALAQGFWMPSEPLRPQEVATWLFVQTVVSRAPQPHLDADAALQPTQPAPMPAPPALATPEHSGLLVDARSMPIQRDMSLRILDENGQLVYPPPDHMPDPDFVDEEGTASYAHTMAETRRAGPHPLRISALRVQGDDIIISHADAVRITQENQHNHFLWNWGVCILVDEDR